MKKNDFKNQSPAALGMAFVGLSAPTLALYGSKGIIIPFIIAALACLYTLFKNQSWRLSIPGPLGLSVLALALWALASLTWTVSFDVSLSLARSLPLTLLAGFVVIYSVRRLDPDGLRLIARATVLGFSLGALLAIADIASGYAISMALHILTKGGEWGPDMPGFVINNGVVILALFLWPACFFLINQNRRWMAFVALVAAGAIAGASSSFASIVAIAVGCASFVLAYFLPRHIHKMTAAGFIVLILGSPFFMAALPDARTIGKDLPELDYSVYPRLVIWQYASNLIMERPVAGHGIRTSRALNKETNPIPFVYMDKGKLEQGNTKAIALHPHNGIMQLWLELGGIGAMIGLALVLSILHGIRNAATSPLGKALLYASLLSSVCLISVTYGLWQSWWMASLWLQGALITAGLGSPDDPAATA